MPHRMARQKRTKSHKSVVWQQCSDQDTVLNMTQQLLNRTTAMLCIMTMMKAFLLMALLAPHGITSYSSFHGHSLQQGIQNGGSIFMRKQKASDKRTSRLQRGEEEVVTNTETVTTSPMQTAQWEHKKTVTASFPLPVKTGGRNRSRKRSALYNSLSSYHTHFLQLLTAEYKAEVSHVSSFLVIPKSIPVGFKS